MQSKMVLKKPMNLLLLVNVYDGQQERLQVIQDEIIEVQQLLEVSIKI